MSPGCSRAGQDENLRHARHLRARVRAERVGTDGNIAPVRQFQTLRGKAFLHKCHGSFSSRRVTGQKKLSEPEDRRQGPETAQEIKRKGEKQTCPVAFASSGGKSAAVGKAGHGGKGVFDDSVSGASVQAGPQNRRRRRRVRGWDG